MSHCSLCHTETNGTSVNSLNLSYIGCEHYFCHECFENSINSETASQFNCPICDEPYMINSNLRDFPNVPLNVHLYLHPPRSNQKLTIEEKFLISKIRHFKTIFIENCDMSTIKSDKTYVFIDKISHRNRLNKVFFGKIDNIIENDYHLFKAMGLSRNDNPTCIRYNHLILTIPNFENYFIYRCIFE